MIRFFRLLHVAGFLASFNKPAIAGLQVTVLAFLLDLKLSEAKVKNLQTALQLGLISQEEFDSKARSLFLKDI
jgi:hypothetical protein